MKKIKKKLQNLQKIGYCKPSDGYMEILYTTFIIKFTNTFIKTAFIKK